MSMNSTKKLKVSLNRCSSYRCVSYLRWSIDVIANEHINRGEYFMGEAREKKILLCDGGMGQPAAWTALRWLADKIKLMSWDCGKGECTPFYFLERLSAVIHFCSNIMSFKIILTCSVLLSKSGRD